MTNELLVKRYKATRKDEYLQEIINNYAPLISKHISPYTKVIPRHLLEAKAKVLIAMAVQSYDPSLGNITVHIDNYLKGISRFANNASPVYIPQERANVLESYKSTLRDMTSNLGRIPSRGEIADELSLPENEITRLGQESKRSIIVDGEIPSYISGVDRYDKDDHLMELVYNRITDPKEKELLELIYGLHGKQQLMTNRELAGRLGVSQTTIRNMKDNLIKYIRTYS